MRKLSANKFHWAVVMSAIVSTVLLSGCGKKAIEPVAIAAEDVCNYCKMAISEKRYAAEFIDVEGSAFKFDDIGCMINFVKAQRQKNEVAAYYVMDFSNPQWLKAEDAYYVRSDKFLTPMNGGIVAFKDSANAEVAAKQKNGKLLRFADLMK